MQEKKAKLIAYYLPQFHNIPENDEWWGNGFTEWTNVGKARSLYKGHEQPKVPTDLGYYDLLSNKIRKKQADLAKESGIDAFCYWHYYFGNGKMLLEKPLKKLIESKSPDFPFCLAWANHSWSNKSWDSNYETNNKHTKLLIEQVYPGKKDVDLHFYTMLDAFKDNRYYKIEEKLVFVIYRPLEIPDLEYFIDRWQILAKKNDLPGFYFIAHSLKISEINDLKKCSFNAINLSLHHEPFDNRMTLLLKIKRYSRSHFFKKPEVVNYSKAIKKMVDPLFKEDKIFPTIIPNWDHTPRSGFFGRVFQNCTPELFGKHVNDILSTIKHKDEVNKIIFIKSWNEWAEGNYLEPDLKHGKKFLNKLKEIIFS